MMFQHIIVKELSDKLIIDLIKKSLTVANL